MVFGLYDIATGRLLSVASVPPASFPVGTAIRDLPSGGVAFVSHDWDEGAADWVPKIVPAQTRLTVLELKARFTQAERDRIEIATVEHPDRTVRARLRMLENDLTSAERSTVDRRDPRLQGGITMLSLITFEDAPLIAAARAAEIIGADAL